MNEQQPRIRTADSFCIHAYDIPNFFNFAELKGPLIDSFVDGPMAVLLRIPLQRSRYVFNCGEKPIVNDVMMYEYMVRTCYEI